MCAPICFSWPRSDRTRVKHVSAKSIKVDATLVPDAASISATRSLVDDISRLFLNDVDASWRLGMAAHELLDNARKYGLESTAALRFSVDATEEGHVATLNVRSLGTSAHIDAIHRLAKDIAQTDDAWGYYLAALTRAGRGTEGSGIGLARIWAEGEMALQLSVDARGYVTVEATLAVSTREAT